MENVNNKIILTIFTPAYNRAYTLGRLYDSLKRQSNNNFEWILINDGSKDDTDKVVQKFLDDNTKNFKMRYKKVKNGGKHRAINMGVQMAKGRIFLILDSDDYLTDDAVEKVIERDKEVPKSYAGFAFNRMTSENKVIGRSLNKRFIDAKATERMKYKILGDKCECFYTSILKKFPFPSFEGEKFITENVVWYDIARNGYKMRWFDESIYICEYLPDGLTKSTGLAERNFKGYTYSTKFLLSLDVSLKEKILALGNYAFVGKKLKFSIKELSEKVNANYFFTSFTFMLCYLKKKVYSMVHKKK